MQTIWTTLKTLVVALIWCTAVAVGVLIAVCGAVISASQNVPRV